MYHQIHSGFKSNLSIILAIVFVLVLSAGNAVSQSSASDQNAKMPACAAPSFSQMREYRIDYLTFPGRYAIGDLNGDNRPDLIIGEMVYGGATTMSIMLGVGSHGGFRDETNYTIGGHPLDFTTADVNNDGNPDVIVTHFSIVEIYLGNGDGSVQTPPILYSPMPVPVGRLSSTVAKDFDNDGNVDLAISTTDLYPSFVYVRFGNGNGTFNVTQTLSVNNVEFAKIYGADLNNDGKLDLISPNDPVSRIFFGNSDGTFAQAVNAPAIQTRDIQIFDINGDGSRDIYSVGNTVKIYYNNGSGVFSAPVTGSLNLPEGANVISGKAADFTGDGILDIAVSTTTPDFRIFHGTSLTTFSQVSLTNTIYPAYSVQTADFNNDGAIDFAAAGYDSSSMYVFNNKCGNTQPTYSIGGGIYNNEGFSINGAQITINSDLFGSLSTRASFGAFFFDDLPSGLDYTVTPIHSLFTFSPTSRTIQNLNANQNLAFEGLINKYKIHGRVVEGNSNGPPAANVPMRLVGPYGTDISLVTDANGIYSFGDLYPIDSSFTYQIQFLANPIFQPTIPLYAIRGLTSDRFVQFTVGRYRFSATNTVIKPDDQPFAGAVLFHGETGAFAVTNSAGVGTFSQLGAGLDHTIIPGIPSHRFTPQLGLISYITQNVELNFRAAQRPRSDFDNDGKTDLAVWRPGNGVWHGLMSANDEYWSKAFGAANDIPVPGDYDGDQRADIAVFRPSDGSWHILTTATQIYSVRSFGAAGDVPIAQDFDRDGKTDTSVYRPATGVWYTYQSYYQNVDIKQWGASGDLPLVGDFNGDTYADRAVFRPSTGVWYILHSVDVSFRAVQFGLGSDKVLVGDYDGDTISDMAVWRPENGAWYIWKSSDNSFRIEVFGSNGDIPLSGDFDGDGYNDLAVYRPSTGVWYIQNSSNQTYTVKNFGLNGDIPLASVGIR